MESALSGSSDEADWDVVARAEASSYPETSSKPDTSLELEASLEYIEDPEGMLVSMHFSSNWEAATTPSATFMGVALVMHTGVTVPRGTYSGSRSL